MDSKLEFNLDSYSFGSLFLGEKNYSLKSRKLSDDGYYFSIEDGVVSRICVFFSRKIYKYERFVGGIIKGGVSLGFSNLTQPEDVEIYFGKPTESFNDGCENNYVYEADGKEIEFSWIFEEDLLVLVYMGVEVV